MNEIDWQLISFASKETGVSQATIHRWINKGLVQSKEGYIKASRRLYVNMSQVRTIAKEGITPKES